MSSNNKKTLIDVGVNLTNQQFNDDLVEVVERSIEANVYPMIITGTDLLNSKNASNICNTLKISQQLYKKVNTSFLYFTAGVHPHSAKKYKKYYNNAIIKLASDPKCVAIGECGLDFNRNFSTKEEQIECFKQHIIIGIQLNKPLFVHERDAHDELINVITPYLKKLPPLVVHCFTGNLEEAKKYLSLGFYLSLSGFICMENRGKKFRENVLPFIPLNKILLETDAPYMHPDSSGKNRIRSEPINTIDVCNTIANVLNVSYDNVLKQTTMNSRKFFRI
jgi:TatD DNase family protein